MYLDYGFTRPNVLSRGPYQQWTDEGCETGGQYDGLQEMQSVPEQVIGPEEVLPTPADAPQPPSASTRPVNSGIARRTNVLPSQVDEPTAQTATNTPVWEWAKR